VEFYSLGRIQIRFFPEVESGSGQNGPDPPTMFITISIIQNSEDKAAPPVRLTFVCFQKVGFHCRVGAGVGADRAGAASKILPGAGDA
jgi:NhaP-type Na+/H+ and K+/H+ antiporter